MVETKFWTKEYFKYCIDNKKPYFGFGFKAQSGSIGHHAYMDALVAQECLNSNEPYNILEIGSYAGMSAVTWAKAIQKYNNGNGQVFCVDPWRPYLKEDENIPEGQDTCKIMNDALEGGQAFKLFIHNIITSNCKDNIVIIRAESDKVLPALSQKFDLIYVDGDHRYEQGKKDLINSIPLVKDRGILSGDDLEVMQTGEWKDPPQNSDCIRVALLNDMIVAFHPGVTKAIWETFGSPVSCWGGGFWAMRKVNEHWEIITIKNLENVKLPEHLTEWVNWKS